MHGFYTHSYDYLVPVPQSLSLSLYLSVLSILRAFAPREVLFPQV